MRMVGFSRVASASPSLPYEKVNAEPFRKTAEIVSFGKAKLPPVPDYAKACRDLIRATWQREPSDHAKCIAAARETGEGMSKFERILSGDTKDPSGRLMKCVEFVAASRGVAIPPALAVRVSA